VADEGLRGGQIDAGVEELADEGAAKVVRAGGPRLRGRTGFRVVHFTPPGSQCSIIVGTGISTAEPGSVQNVHLIVDDIEEARADLVGRGVEVSEIFHDEGGVFHHAGTEKRCRASTPGGARTAPSPPSATPTATASSCRR
jgi:hypothetical protein